MKFRIPSPNPHHGNRPLNTLPLTPEIEALARRVIWFEEPEVAIADPVRFATYAMTYALHEDMQALRRYWTDDDMREALANAPPGIFDGRSWAYWNLMLDRSPAPPLPQRVIPND